MSSLKSVLKNIKYIVILGLLIHFTIKDTFYWSSLFFYGLPLPVLSCLALIVVVCSKKILRKSMFIISLLCLVIWISRSFKMNNEPKVSEGFEVVFWNARHNKQFLDALNESNGIPDVLVMVEYDSDNINNAKDKHPEYHYFVSDSTGFGILSKTPLVMHEEITHDDDSTILSFQTNGFNFYAVDISASYLNFRKTSLHFVNSNIDKQNKTIILGDFNTPLESIHFSFFETYFLNAFNDKGNGFRETWLWNMPLLSLDQIWVSKDVEILKAEKIQTWASDHAMLKTIIRR